MAQSFERLEIVAKSEDIQRYIDHVIDQRGGLQDTIRRDPDLRTDIGESVTQRSSHMFLLAKLHMDSIAAQLSPYNVRRDLKQLPENFQESYRITMMRIEAQNKIMRDYAIRILSWIVCASRPLSVDEILHVLAVEEGDSHIHENRTVRKGNLQELCCGLVVIDDTNTVRLVHYTAQDSFADHRAADFLDFRCRIASTCAKYLCMLLLEQPDILLDGKLENYPSLGMLQRIWITTSGKSGTRLLGY